MGDFLLGYLIVSFFIAIIHSFDFMARNVIYDKVVITRADILFFTLFPLTLMLLIIIFVADLVFENMKKSKIIKWFKEPLRKE
ncbi:TPA: hypothetical protein LA460_000114 [Clostridium botulinum]|nr:hypothetical protein [Clostridium botulinum]HBJ1652719.1 hypothetical protein [Clostridium botulinum]